MKGKYSVNTSEVLFSFLKFLNEKFLLYYNSNKVNFSYLLWKLSISVKLFFFSLEVIKIAYNFFFKFCFNCYVLYFFFCIFATFPLFKLASGLSILLIFYELIFLLILFSIFYLLNQGFLNLLFLSLHFLKMSLVVPFYNF